MGSISEVAPVPSVDARSRAARFRVTRAGLATFAFLLPMLVIFGLFAWFPIIRAFVMSVQDTNLVSDPVYVGLQNFQRVLADPLLGIAVRNTAWFAFLALIFGFPVPIILAVLMSELRHRRGLFSALAYLPVVVPPVVSVSSPTRYGPTKPPTCPREPTKAMPAAAAVPRSSAVGTHQNGA